MGGDSFCFNRLSLKVVSGSVTLKRADAVEVRYPFSRLGRFASSDPVLDKLWEICARSLEILSEDSYVDCSDRERVEWMDDSPPAFDCTRVLMAGPREDGGKVWSDPRLMQGLLRRTALTQQPDGQMKAHTCSERWDVHAIMEDRSCDWVIGAQQYFECTGDAKFIREIWPAMTRLMDWFLSRRTTRGLVQAREWEVWDNPLRYQVCEGAGLNAFVYHALKDAAFLGSMLGEQARSADFSAAAAQLADVFNRLLWDDVAGSYSGALFGPTSQINTRKSPPVGDKLRDGVYVPTVQAALLCLDSGIVPTERLERVRKFVVDHQADVTGVMSHHFLFKALYEMNRPELDVQVLSLMRTGWKAQIESEWQTSWEDLKGGSKVHMYGLHPAYWLSAFVLGVRVRGPAGDRALLIEPRCSELTSCEGVVVTEFGPVPVKWKKDHAGRVTVECTVPERVRATIRLRQAGSASSSLLIDGKKKQATIADSFLCFELGPGPHTAGQVL
jgi:hypothetical protein